MLTHHLKMNANSAIFVCGCERFDEKKFNLVFEKMGEKLNKGVLVNWGFLDKIQKDQALLKRFVNIIRKPESYETSQRILQN